MWNRQARLDADGDTVRIAVVLAAHGSREEPAVNEYVRSLASQLERTSQFGPVRAAFHQGDPSFSAVLDMLDADRVCVVPFMSSEGYFSDVVLPRELAGNACYKRCGVIYAAAIGTHPAISSLVLDRIRDRLARFDLVEAESSVVLVGHGTRQCNKSREATLTLASKLSSMGLSSSVTSVFLDDDPIVEQLWQTADQESVLIVPFFMTNSPHVMRDIPSRVGLVVSSDATWPLVGRVNNRKVVCDTAVGTDPGIFDIVVDSLRGKMQILQELTV